MSVEQRDPAVCNGSNKTGGKGEMTKAPVSLQDLRRSLYAKTVLWTYSPQNRLGVSGDYTSTSARWRLCGKPTRWREVMAGHRVSTGSRSEPLRKAERRIFSCRFGMN